MTVARIEKRGTVSAAGPRVSLACDLAVGAAIAGYAILLSARTISAYTSGTSLFDLATYVQGFHNALGDPPFFYSLEGEMSRFGRHFSPFFYVLLPFYALYPDPSTLLALQALFIGLGALPVYWLAGERLGKPAGLAFALAYLGNPAVHEINVQNDFHEIAFALPLLLFVFYLGLGRRTVAYALALLLAISTREEVALTTVLFGLYLILFQRRRRLGAATLAASVAWFALVSWVVMPAYNAEGHFPMPEGYAYLGGSPFEVARGVVAHPDLALREVLRRPKAEYVFWLVAPLALLPLAAPEALAIAAIALLEVLISTYSYHFRIFERYAAPIVPVVFFAACLGAARVRRFLPSGERWPLLLGALVIAATLGSQRVLQKAPTYINFSPDAHGAIALAVAGSVPGEAAVAVADHRLLPHLARRRHLYVLSPGILRPDYVIFDRKRVPITNVAPAERVAAEERFLRDPEYATLRCDDGVYLLGRLEAIARGGGPRAEAIGSAEPPLAAFGDVADLVRVEVATRTARPGGSLEVTPIWRARQRAGADYQVFVHLMDAGGRLRAQHDGAPQDKLCPTTAWSPGLVVRDRHIVPLPDELSPGRYELRVGLYDLATMRRLPVESGSAGADSADYFATSVEVRP